MATMKIKKGDMVKVIAGKDKDKEGKVISVNKKDNKVLVEGINMVTKHAKPSMAKMCIRDSLQACILLYRSQQL